jgi:NADH dehydrogenase
MARIAVTGAPGFVGRHLIPLLVRDGHEVRGLARRGSAVSPVLDAIAMVRGDVRSLDEMRSVIEGCDMVIHLAASFSPRDDVPEITLIGTTNVVRASQESGIQRLVYLSCLGADAAAPPFYASKWRAENLVRSSGLSHVILRPSLALGRDDGLLGPLAQLIGSFPVIPIPGRGEHRLQPIDVDDLARCILISLTSDAMENELVSVGGSTFVTFRQLTDLVSGHLGISKSKLLVPRRWLPALSQMLPAPGCALYSPPRLDQFLQGGVSSPGIVPRMFGFQPASIVRRLDDYLA